MIQLAEHFGNKDHNHYSNGLRQHQWFIKARIAHQRREASEDKLENDFLSLATEAIIATQFQIKEFKVKLDAYDEATVKALMENHKALDLINTQIDAFLDRAYVLKDGRHVFKTVDGTQVFDERGQEVSPEELDFDLINPDSPAWETFEPLLKEGVRLENERKSIIEFQEKLDNARDRISEDEISKPDLDELDAELKDAMPPSVKTQVPGFDGADNALDLKSEFQSSAKQTITTFTSLIPTTPDLNPMN